jgi:16S rRNA (uracil1498-N3)-methyltransferase
MELFLLTGNDIPTDEVVFEGDEARHIARVLRHQPGDIVFATDGRGTEYEVEIGRIEAGRVHGRIRNRRQNQREPSSRVSLAQGIMKGDGLAEVVQGVTQLGVAGIVPLRSARSVAWLSASRLERMRKVATEATKSSTRTVIPRVTAVQTPAELIERFGTHDRVLIAYEGEREKTLEDVLVPPVDDVLLVVGPEGGFDDSEVEMMREAGAICYSMGPRRLRAELAGVVAVATTMQLLGEMGVGGNHE